MTVVSRAARRIEQQRKRRPFCLPSVTKTAVFAWRTGARNVLVGRRFRIINQGTLHLQRDSSLRFGTTFYGFLDGRERGLIRNRGVLVFAGSVCVSGGGRFYIEPDAIVTIGTDTYFSPNVLLVACERISVGENCAVGWDVQLLDADYHAHGSANALADLPPATTFTAPIEIGHHVWIGSGAKIYKGVKIADGCIVAGNSVVTRSVMEVGSLVAGNPARIVKTGVVWE